MNNQISKTSSPTSPQVKEKSRSARPKSSVLRNYLLGYNGLNFLLWSMILLRATLLIPILYFMGSLHSLPQAIFPYLKYTQTIAVLEIIHASVGMVRANPITTTMQVLSRLVVVWGILTPYPEIVSQRTLWGGTIPGATGGPAAFAGICMAWGVTEVIRYGFFLYKEGIGGEVPSWLTWLRYNTFFILYPIGISSECWLMYITITPAARGKTGFDWILKAILLIYVPGSYVLYTHMMAQRRKIMKGKNKKT